MRGKSTQSWSGWEMRSMPLSKTFRHPDGGWQPLPQRVAVGDNNGGKFIDKPGNRSLTMPQARLMSRVGVAAFAMLTAASFAGPANAQQKFVTIGTGGVTGVY